MTQYLSGVIEFTANGRVLTGLTELAFAGSKEKIDTTTTNTQSWKQQRPILKGLEFSGSILWEQTETATTSNIRGIFALWAREGGGIAYRFAAGDTAANPGAPVISGTGFFDSIDGKAGIAETIGGGWTFMEEGQPTITIPDEVQPPPPPSG